MVLRGTYSERKEQLSSRSKEWLEAAILDSEYNNFLSSRADYEKDEEDKHGAGKRLPYIGWYWRHIVFSGDRIPIGDCGDFIGFIANNKWDYPDRYLTPEEKDKVLEIIDEAMRLNSQGGLGSEILANTEAKLDELWDYLQTLTI
jgi:hypothetical protein